MWPRRSTPAAYTLFDTRDAPKVTAEEVKFFRSYVAKLLYLAKRVRPECLVAVAFLTTRVNAVDVDDMAKLKRVLGYLRATQHRGIVLRVNNEMAVHAYIDAAYAVHPKMESHTGSIVTIGRFGVSLQYKSLKQKLVTTSSTEAELVAIYDALDFVLWMRDIMEFLHCSQGTTTIYQDNTSTICMAHMGRGSSSSRTKHIKLRYFWIKQFIDDKTFIIENLPTDNMIADFFASPRTGQAFRRMRNLLLGMAENA
jgi:hypothetical protein